MPTPVKLIRGTTAFVKAQLDGLLTNLNADLAANVIAANASPPVFTSGIGKTPAPGGPLLTVGFVGYDAVRIAQSQKLVTVRMMIYCYLLRAGDDTPMNFEMAEQTAAEWVLNTFENDGIVLTPTVNAGVFGTIKAYEAERGDLEEIPPNTRLVDGKTIPHGWQMPFSATYSVQTR